ncbi:MAG: DUF4190 domain-containing protein [Bifidobacteriaceae bacterium]|nr:DUF4190 domain-containing protein [Bifidobacteriaceae bacterium]MCI1978128.1 DUF4190 domain-containing protein [Bifidobacteriaceae bacterium]
MSEPGNDPQSGSFEAQGHSAGQPGQESPSPVEPPVRSSSAAPTASSQPAASSQQRPAAPEYGQRQKPEYGQLSSQFPGWDPYIYGKPEPEAPRGDAAGDGRGNQSSGNQNQQNRQNQPLSRQPQQGFGPQNGTQGTSRGSGTNGNGNGNGPRFQFQQIDPNDPRQNPYYGHWDSMAIVAFVTSFFIPLFPLFLGWMSLRRTKVLHMKGRGLAIAAMVISVILLILEFMVMFTGDSSLNMLMQQLGYVPVDGGEGSIGVTTAFLTSFFA